MLTIFIQFYTGYLYTETMETSNFADILLYVRGWSFLNCLLIYLTVKTEDTFLYMDIE